MPQFELDLGGPESRAKYKALDAFTQGYIEAMFFTAHTADEDDVYFMPDWSLDLLAPETWQKIVDECEAFQVGNAAALAAATTMDDPDCARHAGRDLWYTRNGHGCGYWDGGIPDPSVADVLSDAARAAGERDMYLGDDGKLYLCP